MNDPTYRSCERQDSAERATEALLLRVDLRERREYVRGFKAMMLSPTVDLCRSLLAGERVPWNQLNYFQAQRYGLKRRRPDGRYGVDDFHDVREGER